MNNENVFLNNLYNPALEDVISFDAIWDSAMRCKKGVIWKDSVASFIINDIEKSVQLSNCLEDGSYKESPHKYFTVTEPKRREVMSIAFRDRVYQRSLNDNVLYPIMTRGLIRDNCACQTHRGTRDARNRLTCFFHKYYRKYGSDGYILQMDIKGYYPNMRHDVAKEELKKKLPEEYYNMAVKILDGFSGDTGFNPGSQVIQIIGISLLNRLDHYCKEKLKLKYYQRYMDDFVILHNDKSYLIECCELIKKYLGNMGFELNVGKTRIYTMSHGIRYLGFIFRLTNTGKVLKLIPGEKVKHERKKLYRLIQLAKKGKITKEKCDQCYESWKSHVSEGNTYKVLQRMDAYYRGLWKVN